MGISPMINSRQAPAYSIKPPRPVKFYLRSPGPAAYNSGNTDLLKSSQPAYSLGGRYEKVDERLYTIVSMSKLDEEALKKAQAAVKKEDGRNKNNNRRVKIAIPGPGHCKKE